MRERIRASVVGRERELDLVLAAVAAGRDLLLEGPPGTSKTTMLRAITADWGIPLRVRRGQRRADPGQADRPSQPGPGAARGLQRRQLRRRAAGGGDARGGFLYIEEFNRAPEDTLNTLLTAMAERADRGAAGRAGPAAPTFRVVASMNPFDNVGTTRLSTSRARPPVPARDRLPGRGRRARHRRVARAAAPRSARAGRTAGRRRGRGDPGHPGPSPTSGRAAASAAPSTSRWSRASCSAWATSAAGDDERYRETVFDAMIVALSGRIFLDETAETRPRSRCCARSGRTTSCSARPPPTPVEEPSRPTRRSAARRAVHGRGGRCAATRRSSPRSRRCSRPRPGGGALPGGPGAGSPRRRVTGGPPAGGEQHPG